jgi:hypothetical protein
LCRGVDGGTTLVIGAVGCTVGIEEKRGAAHLEVWRSGESSWCSEPWALGTPGSAASAALSLAGVVANHGGLVNEGTMVGVPIIGMVMIIGS